MDLAKYSIDWFDRGAPRWKEALWVLTRWMVFQTGLPLPVQLRAFLLRCFGARIGHGLKMRERVYISFPWRLEIGDHVWIGEEVTILSLAPVKIESNVCISQKVFLCTGSHNFYQSDFALQTKPITIRSNSWVAAQAFVGPGVEIGPGAVVSAGSVVFDNVAPNALVQGNPARQVKLIERR